MLTEEIIEEHSCVGDRKDGKLRFRVWPKKVGTNGGCEFTLKLTDKERIALIHMLSE